MRGIIYINNILFEYIFREKKQSKKKETSLNTPRLQLNQDFSFSNKGNVRVPVQFRRERHSHKWGILGHFEKWYTYFGHMEFGCPR